MNEPARTYMGRPYTVTSGDAITGPGNSKIRPRFTKKRRRVRILDDVPTKIRKERHGRPRRRPRRGANNLDD